LTITERQNNYILRIIQHNKDAEEYFNSYMQKTKDDPEGRDLNKLLQTLITIKEASETHGRPISKENISKLDELCKETPLFKRDVEAYLSKKNAKTLDKLRQYDAIQLKLLYIDRHMRR